MTTTKPTAPSHLSKPAQRLWQEIVREYALDGPGHRLLLRALEAGDRCDECRAILNRDGLITDGRFGPKAHPLLATERQSRDQEVRAWIALGLEPPDKGRR